METAMRKGHIHLNNNNYGNKTKFVKPKPGPEWTIMTEF